MADTLLILRCRSPLGFQATRAALRHAIETGMVAFSDPSVTLVSLSPLPRDRYIRPRKSPERKTFPLLDYAGD